MFFHEFQNALKVANETIRVFFYFVPERTNQIKLCYNLYVNERMRSKHNMVLRPPSVTYLPPARISNEGASGLFHYSIVSLSAPLNY